MCICVYVCIYIYIHNYAHLSLSLSIYIYIYIYMVGPAPGPMPMNCFKLERGYMMFLCLFHCFGRGGGPSIRILHIIHQINILHYT